MSATQIVRLVREKRVSALEVARSFCKRIGQTEPLLDAFLHFDEEEMLRQAAMVDRRLARGEDAGRLAGLPVGLKDNICTRGIPTTCASRMLGRFVPPYDAFVVRKLRKGGAVLGGKLNMDEFAMGSSCENSAFKVTKNPWDVQRAPGGSSGGSAAAVAACQLPLALGSDTGGSVRQPAAFCGLVGLRPTYGAVSRNGLVAFASSLDQIGPLARSADDVWLLFSAICGRDPDDATSRAYPCWNENGLLSEEPSLSGLVVGVPQEYYETDVQPSVLAAVEQGLRQLVSLGARIVPIALPSAQYALAAYYIISSAEASSNLARYDGIRYGFSAAAEEAGSLSSHYEATRSAGFGKEAKRRILLGTFVLSSGHYDAFYRRAKGVQRRMAREFAGVLQHCDVIAMPTVPTTAFYLGEKIHTPTEMYVSDRFTVPASMAGLPAVSFPCGTDGEGIPVGMQLIGPAFSEEKLLEIVKCYEVSTGGFSAPEVAL